MRANKKLSTRKEAIVVERHEKLPPWNSRELFEMRNLGSTKSWLRETSRCNGGGDHLRLLYPQLYHLDDPPCSLHHKIDDSICRILPSRLVKIPSKFAPINFVPEIFTHPYDRINTRLELSGVASPALMLYRSNWFKDGRTMKHEGTLTKYECNTVDPFDAERKSLYFTSIVEFEGVFFALSLQGALAVMQEIDSLITITAMSKSRAVPSVSNWRFFKEYLVELNGEILLVFLIHEKTVRVVDKVEVYRLCFPDLKWIKVERIQDKTLFLDRDCRIYVNSKEIGGGENCIYFTQGSNNCWWKYNMGRDCISPA